VSWTRPRREKSEEAGGGNVTMKRFWWEEGQGRQKEKEKDEKERLGWGHSWGRERAQRSRKLRS